LRDTTRTTALIVFVMIGATVFSLVFRRLGGDAMIAEMFQIDQPKAVSRQILACHVEDDPRAPEESSKGNRVEPPWHGWLLEVYPHGSPNICRGPARRF
jgi:hypothetical protein